MTPRKARIKEFFAPPVFPDDEAKTHTARVLNTILLTMLLYMVLIGGIAVPLVFVEKLYSELFVLAAILMLVAAYQSMRRGRVRLASTMFACALWIIATVFMLLSGGMTSVIAALYITGTVAAGLLLGTRAALAYAVTCILAGLGMVILEASGHSLPHLFSVPALSGWMNLVLNLLLTVTVLNLVLRSLNDALALAHQQAEERKQAEEEQARLLVQVREQAQRIQRIMDTVPEGVFLLDTDRHVVVTNPLAKKCLRTLANGKASDTLTHLGNRPLNELLTSPKNGLWHEAKVNGQSFEIVARPLEAALQPSGWVLVVREVTQQREAERYLQQQERLAALGQLAAGIAHDFNNILAVITLYTSMSSRIPDLPAIAYDRLGTIDQQAKRASALVQQILDFSRRAVLERGPLDLLTFLKEQVKLLERTLPESIQIKLIYGQDEQDAPLVVNADPTRIQQAILNLATNARDAMPEGGQLRLGLERLRIADHDTAPLPEITAGEWACVTVTDTGAGIPPDMLPHVFDPFFTTKAPDRGTGLGLSQVYGIIRQHEGRVDVQTQVGEGTTFTFYLPALSIDRSDGPRIKTELLPKGEKQTILVVEDQTGTRKAMVESLEMLDYRVLEAANGKDALATFEQHSGKIDLVLTDLVMPKMGGRALFHALKQQDRAIKILVMSGHPLNEQELEDLRAQGLGGWLPKPPSLEQLAQAVKQMLEEGHCFCPPLTFPSTEMRLDLS